MPTATLPPFLTERKHHWKARSMLNKEFKEVFAAEIISVTGGLLAGSLIAIYIKQLLLIPGLFILLPGFLEMRGNISGALAARLGTALDLKFIKPRIRGNKVVPQNILATFIETLIVALSLAAVAYAVTYLLFGNATLEIFAVALIAAFISNIIEATLTTITTFWLYRAGHDPNNVMGPYVTTTGDIISILSLLFAVFIISLI